MKLLFRGYKKKDEFIGDYVKRVANKNGYLKSIIFERLLRADFGDEYNRYGHSLARRAIPRLGLEKLLQRNIPLDEFHRYNHTKRYIWSKSPAPCIKCQNEEPYTRFYWWFTSYKYCHIHGCPTVSENLKNNSLKNLDATCLPEKLIEEIVRFYEREDLVQSLVLDEIERFYLDHSIVSSLIENFSGCGVSKNNKETILKAIWSKKLVGQPASVRISNIACIFGSYVGVKSFWLRMVTLTFRSNVKGALSYKGHWFQVNEEYSRYCNFIMGMDPRFREVFPDIGDFRKRSDMERVCLLGVLEGSPEMSENLIGKIKVSMFSSRHLKGWVSSIQKAEDFWEIKSSREFYYSIMERFV